MVFKWITSYLARRSLEKHRLATEWKVKEYEQKAESVHRRLKAQADNYQAELQALAQQREADLQLLQEKLEDHAIHTSSYVEQLAQLQTRMLGCLEHWLVKSTLEARVELQREQIQGVRNEIDLLLEIAEDIRRLGKMQEHDQWRSIIEGRPPRVDTPEIHEYIRGAEAELARETKDSQREIRRLLSQVRTLRVQLRRLREAYATIRDQDLTPTRERFRQSRAELREHFQGCRTRWMELQNALDACYRNRVAESELANEWLAETANGGNYHELQQILLDAQQESNEINDQQDLLSDRMNAIKSRINAAHQNRDYSELDGLKGQRTIIFEQLKENGARGYEVRQAMKELRDRRAKMRDLRTLIERLHPAETVQSVFERVGKDDPDLYWSAIGLTTKALPRPVKEAS
ncbi:hypothetical protein [Paraburkholderia caribensis]|uniref:hypothetical protein n=1 Tax=Paraburkholderia caribensis TaxID=75105 RepID=UPI001CB04D4E|nr:hypothetical protein [Paraburkholderia caribensis]CAG9269763.1 conserved hypothetical protein [Paraburkholderia caribensis]